MWCCPDFSKEIKEISPLFVEIYNDASKAEQSGLLSIVGLGYRLAFEHLIKDYCIKCHPNDRDEIIKMPISKCIQNFLGQDIKDIFNRATWLGNDFSHYESKHPDMNLNDLKAVIDICISDIEMRLKKQFYMDHINKL